MWSGIRTFASGRWRTCTTSPTCTKVIRSLGAKVVFIDPVADLVNIRAAGGTYREMRQAVLALRPPVPDVAVIGVLHSARRSTDSVSGYIGSAGQGGACDLLLDFTNPQQGGVDDSYRLLKVSKSRCRAAQVQGTLYRCPSTACGIARQTSRERRLAEGRFRPRTIYACICVRIPARATTATARHFRIPLLHGYDLYHPIGEGPLLGHLRALLRVLLYGCRGACGHGGRPLPGWARP